MAIVLALVRREVFGVLIPAARSGGATTAKEN